MARRTRPNKLTRMPNQAIICSAENVKQIMHVAYERTQDVQKLTQERLIDLMIQINQASGHIDQPINKSRLALWFRHGMTIDAFEVFDLAIRQHCDACDTRRQAALDRISKLESYLGIVIAQAS